MKTTILAAIALVMLMGCYSQPTKDFKPTPEMQAKFDAKVTETTETALNKMIDDKVSKSVEKALPSKVQNEVEKALPKAVQDGIGRWVFDTGPYGMIALLTLLLGKHWWELKQERKKNGKAVS